MGETTVFIEERFAISDDKVIAECLDSHFGYFLNIADCGLVQIRHFGTMGLM